MQNRYGHDRGNNKFTTSFNYTPDFQPVIMLADQISDECGISRSTVFKTLLADSMGITPDNEIQHKTMLKNIKEALGRRQ
jgi:hypothetical protein